jgi:hypothetical protein
MHDVLQSTFARELTNHRKVYPRKFVNYLVDGLVIRSDADYRHISISAKQARGVLKWAQEFVRVVTGGES